MLKVHNGTYSFFFLLKRRNQALCFKLPLFYVNEIRAQEHQSKLLQASVVLVYVAADLNEQTDGLARFENGIKPTFGQPVGIS